MLSYSLSLTGLLSGLVSSFTQTEAMMVSVERLEEYSCDIPQEPHSQPLQVCLFCHPGPGLPGMGCVLQPSQSFPFGSWLSFPCVLSHYPLPVSSAFASTPVLAMISPSPFSPQSPHQRISWLTQGSVEFQDVVLVYRPGLPNALDGVTFRVEPGEKLGIVGRTGSGKSSLFLVLFRLLEPRAGRVLLDGVDTSLLELAELRSGGQKRAVL